MNRLIKIVLFLLLFGLFSCSYLPPVILYKTIKKDLKEMAEKKKEADKKKKKVSVDTRKIFFDYSGNSTTLHADGFTRFSGWEVQDNEVSSHGSQVRFGINLGEKWWQNFSMSASSSKSLFPSEFGNSSSSSFDLASLEMIFGLSEGFLPRIEYNKENFYSTGIVVDKKRFYRNGRVLSPGEKFNVGLRHSYLVAVWDIYDLFYLGGGISAFEFTGNRVINKDVNIFGNFSVEEEFAYSGTIFLMGFNRNFNPWDWEKIDISFDSKNFMSSAKVGLYFKYGFDLGVKYKFYKENYIMPWYGVYLWNVSTFDFDSEIASTNFGRTLGLKFSVGL